MNRYIPDEIVEQIRDRADIVEVAGAYIQVKRAGANRFKALCPFHNEKTPSFHLNQERQAYHCFGCGKGGDVFGFIMEKENVDFPNAVHLLADKYNIIIPEDAKHSGGGGDNLPKGPRKDRLYKLNTAATEFFVKNLLNTPDSQVGAYLKTRNLPPEIIADFSVGAAPDDWHAIQNHLATLQFTQEEMIASGILIENESKNVYDRFRNRLMFTIWDEQGRVVGFSGRSVENDPKGGKYVNTPETPLFKKSKILYALPLAREAIKQHSHVILCEGQMDAIALHRAGFKNAVAPQGTAFTDEQARMLKRYTDNIKIAFDSDSAGAKATIRSIEIMLPIGFDIKVVNMPPNSDPDQIFAESGSEGLLNVLNSAVDFFDFALADAKTQNDISSPWGKSAVTDRMLGLIGHLTKDVLRAEYASKLASELQLPESAVFQELNKNNRRNAMKASFTAARHQARATARDENAPPTATTSPEAYTPQTPPGIVKAESYLLELALSHGTVGRELAEELPSTMITNTPLGIALNMVISMTLNDEWDQAANAVRDFLTRNPDSEISKVLAAPELFRDDTEDAKELRRKALKDCVRCIKLHHSKADTQKVRENPLSEAAMQAFQEKLNKRKALEPEKKRLKPKNREKDPTINNAAEEPQETSPPNI